MKSIGRLMISCILVVAAGTATSQTWTPLTNQPPAATGPMLQLRDGRILVNESQGPDPGVWFILTPDATGSYVNGTWSTTGHLPAGYAPVYFGSQVLLNGRQVVIEGGEYNNGVAVWTNMGAIGTIVPWGNVSWVPNSPPTGWTTIGDAGSITLANGHYMQSNCCTSQNAIFQGPNSWLATGSVIQPDNDESGLTLLTNNKVLTVDAKNSACGNGTNGGAELYDQGTGTWSCTGQTPIHLYNPNDEELGAAVLMYDNKVFQSGGNIVATAIYDVASGTWTAGPTPPNGLDQADGPSALEPNGKVLVDYSPGLFNTGCQFMEFDPNTSLLSFTSNNGGCPSGSSFYGHLMILPTGQIMFTDFGNSAVSVYSPAPGVVAAAKPTILAQSTRLTLVRGSVNNVLWGSQFNGLSQNNAYGDDYQGDTNYPLVRLTNTSTGNVYYAFTHDDSTHSIAPGTIMYTMFDIPASLPVPPSGGGGTTYLLNLCVNGICSDPIHVIVQ
ncbi:MAG: hypothetical protein WBS19_17605 [Candidatus Korobacteraceae bacterium]